MSKLLEVREFDTIICKAEYKDDTRYKYLEPKYFNELQGFIQNYSKEKDNDALDFMSLSFKSRDIGYAITIKNYVGVVQLPSGFQVQILPKVTINGGDAGEDITKQIFCRMLRCLKEFSGKSFTNATLNTNRMNLYDIFISMYLQEVRQIVKRGLKSAYIPQEDNLKFYKGKLLVNRHVKCNMVHKERFYVKYDEFSQNRAENRLIKTTLLKLKNKTRNMMLGREINQLLISFENVECSVNIDKDFSLIVSDRTTKEYSQVLSWSMIFLKDKSFTTFSGDDNSRTLLFPMERVFESYVAKMVSRVFAPDGWHVSAQDKKHYLFVKPEKKFLLRPDIVLCKGGRTIIMDTKWKRLKNNLKINYGISQADMYQMYAYAKKYKTQEIYLLYPQTEELSMQDEKIFISREDDGDIYVKVIFLDLVNLVDQLSDLKNTVFIKTT